MLKQFLKSTLMFTLLGALFLTSCDIIESQLDSDSEIVQTFVDESIFQLEESSNAGRFGCFEFIFPITVLFPDETSTEVNSYEELREALKNWRMEQAEIEIDERPSLGFPLEVLTEDGEVISIAEWSELRTLRRMCRRDFFQNNRPNGHGERCGRCFKIVYPISISFPDGTTETAENRRAFKQLVRAWKENHPDVEERPELVFPISVELEDETIVEVNNKEELQELKESCRD